MVRVGCHVSIAGSLAMSVERATERGCDTFQIFTGNPRGWKVKDLDHETVETFRYAVAKSPCSPIVAHMPYLPNLASPKEEGWQRSIETLIIQLRRCEVLGIPYLVTHLGSHLGAGADIGEKRLKDALSQALAAPDTSEVTLLLENTAGTKNSMGSTFSEIGRIIDGCNGNPRLGICYDTCHAFAAGYDLTNESAIEATLDEIDAAAGPDRLRLIHLNDTKGPCGSHLDRHEHIGLGQIGEEGMRMLVNNPIIASLPLICETPVDAFRGDAENIQAVRDLEIPNETEV